MGQITQMNNPMPVLVTGPTGNVGREVVRSLLERGQIVRGAALTAEEAARLPEGVERVIFDFMDPATYGPALEGIRALFLLRPPALGEVEQQLFPLIDAAADRGLEQIVFLSLFGVEQNKRIPHYRVEQHIRARGIPFTFLRPSYYMQNLNTVYRERIRDQGEIFLPAGRGRTAFIDVRDIGDLAGKVLSEPGHLGQAYAITGRDALNYYEIAGILSEVLGREIRYTKPTQRRYLKQLATEGASPEYLKVQKILYTPVRWGLAAQTTAELERLLGRPPISFRQYAEDYASAWQ